MTLPLFADLGTTHPRNRGSRYRNVLADLRAQFRRDEIERLKSRTQRHLEESNLKHQIGANP